MAMTAGWTASLLIVIDDHAVRHRPYGGMLLHPVRASSETNVLTDAAAHVPGSFQNYDWDCFDKSRFTGRDARSNRSMSPVTIGRL
jgi:hypothetical protein